MSQEKGKQIADSGKSRKNQVHLTCSEKNQNKSKKSRNHKSSTNLDTKLIKLKQ